jgi:hypothetical protein
MPLTNFPNGVTSFGFPVLPGPLYNYWGGGKVFWVCNRSGVTSGDGSAPDKPFASLFTATTGAIAKIGGVQGSLIIVLPGHVESITASTNMSTLAGSGATFLNIVGMGNGALRPTLNWTAAGSALLCNLQGLSIRNMVFNLNATAATVVTAAITHSAADQVMDTVDLLPNTSATQLTTTAITVASGADNLTYQGVRGFGETFATNPTDFFTTTAAVNKLSMVNCRFLVAVNATGNGAINLVNAPTNVYIEDCVFANKKASSTVGAIASASTTGFVDFVTCGITAATGGATSFGTPGNLWFGQTFGTVQGKSGILATTTSG